MHWARFRLPAVLTVLRLPLVLLSVGLCPSWPLALEVQLEVRGDDGITIALRQSSLVEALEGSETPTGQEVLSAAKADYARLIAVLYDAGYFGPVVSIRLDGREASEIRAFDAANVYRKALIKVETGPAFRFGEARIGPLAPETTLPDGFRVGAPAGTRIIRSAVDGSVEAWRSAGHAKIIIRLCIFKPEAIAETAPQRFPVNDAVRYGNSIGREINFIEAFKFNEGKVVGVRPERRGPVIA